MRPMIYYPIQTLVNARIRETMLVTGGSNAGNFLKLLGNGQEFDLQHLNLHLPAGEGGSPTRSDWLSISPMEIPSASAGQQLHSGQYCRCGPLILGTEGGSKDPAERSHRPSTIRRAGLGGETGGADRRETKTACFALCGDGDLFLRCALAAGPEFALVSKFGYQREK